MEPARMLSSEAIEILRGLVYWLRFGGIVAAALGVPLFIFSLTQWYALKRLHALHTTEVDRSGFGTNACADRHGELIKLGESAIARAKQSAEAIAKLETIDRDLHRDVRSMMQGKAK